MLGAQPRQGVGMCSYTSRAAALALLVGALACSDRPPGTAPDAAGGPNVLSTATNPELLARSLALALGDPAFRAHVRSEEHTSELQSRPHLVCRLLLEQKNTHRVSSLRPPLSGLPQR